MNWGTYLRDFPNCFQALIDEPFRQVIYLSIYLPDFFHEEAMLVFIFNHKPLNLVFLNGFGKIWDPLVSNEIG